MNLQSNSTSPRSQEYAFCSEGFMMAVEVLVSQSLIVQTVTMKVYPPWVGFDPTHYPLTLPNAGLIYYPNLIFNKFNEYYYEFSYNST